jgi:multimeric flavodoxin WrbA
MSKIIVLVGSVRKGGNTETLASAFADGAGQRHDVELVSVADYRVHPCLGCNRCYTSEGHQCFQQDDMVTIYGKLMEAEVIVVASPVYFYGISAKMKALVDWLHTPMRNDFRIRKLGLILVGAATLPDLFDPILLQYRMILRFFHLEDIGTVLVNGAKDKGDVLQGDGLKRAFEMGSTLV